MDSTVLQGSDKHAAAPEETRDPRPDAARKRLRECKSQAEAFEAIREIVSNLLGCEEMALFGLDRKHRRFSLLWSFGVEDKTFHLPNLFVEAALPGVLAGHAYIDEGFGDSETGGKRETASAFVPIRFHRETHGVLALFRLLPQKARIDELDRKLFAVLTEEAGRPLFVDPQRRPGKRERQR